MMEWTLYVLLNEAGIAYTGIARDVKNRLNLHNSGTGAKFTRGRGPWKIIYIEGPLSHGDALRRERSVKKDQAFKSRLKEHARLGVLPSFE
jgi:putative endonuclease